MGAFEWLSAGVSYPRTPLDGRFTLGVSRSGARTLRRALPRRATYVARATGDGLVREVTRRPSSTGLAPRERASGGAHHDHHHSTRTCDPDVY